MHIINSTISLFTASLRLSGLIILSSIATLVLLTPTPVSAETIDVSASVPAPLPIGPAVITSPTDGSNFDQSAIVIFGTCPTNGAYVVIERNNQAIGTAVCDNDRFELPITLVPEANVLIARVYNITDNAGPVAAPVTFYYTLVTPTTILPFPPSTHLPSVLQPEGEHGECLATPILLSHSPYSPTRNQNERWQWNIVIKGGCLPYEVTIDWNDGTSEAYTIRQETTLSLSHIYRQPGTFKPLISVSDAIHTRATLQLLAIVSTVSQSEKDTSEDNTPLSSLIPIIGVAVTSAVILTTAITQMVRIRIKKP